MAVVYYHRQLHMNETKTWAKSLGVATTANVPPIADYSQLYAYTAQDIAIRAVLLQGIVAVAYGVEAQPIIEWFQNQKIWDSITPKERAFFGRKRRTKAECIRFQWQQEAEWTLLWMIGRVKTLGLPTKCCDTRRLVDEIIPALGDDLQGFIEKSKLRSPGEILAEDERTYNLWCHALAAQHNKESLPIDLNLGVLRERRYAFEWIDGQQEWDEVTCDT